MLKQTKAKTTSQKNLIKIYNTSLSKKPLLKSKLKGLKNTSGRNNSGKIVSHHKGGGHKRTYRKVNFKENFNSYGIVTSIEYDPNRTANIISVYNFKNKNTYSYKIAPKYIQIGDIIKTGTDAEIKLGHTLPLSKIPEGYFIYNLYQEKNGSAVISRSAGTYSVLIEKTSNYCKVKLGSGTVKNFSLDCLASIGKVSNDLRYLIIVNKAGKSRWLNKRPTVRGVAMNPVDHPHGGGEGKKSGRKRTPWGKK